MDIFRPPTPSDQEGSAWERIENYVKEERPLESVRTIVVNGSVDVVFRRSDKPLLVVAGETAAAVASVDTRISGGKLRVQREGATVIYGNGSRMMFRGAVGSFASGDLGGSSLGSADSRGKVVVGVALPEAPDIKLAGSGSATLLDIRQAGLHLNIVGSGDITAHGQVGELNVEIAGSGDVTARDLIADQARLSISGSGDIEAFVRSEVRARVAGSGDILVRGDPPRRDHGVAGSGRVKFR